MKMLDELRARLTPKTPAERERLKRIAVYTVLCLSCLVCIRLIFAPSGDDDAVKGKANTELPDGTTDGMPETKIEAYRQDEDAKERASRQANLVRISESLDTIQQPQNDTVPDEIRTRLTLTNRHRHRCRTSISLKHRKPICRWRSCRNASPNWRCSSHSRTTVRPPLMRWNCLNAHTSSRRSIWATAIMAAIHNLRHNKKKKAKGMCSLWRRSAAMSFPHCRQHLQGLSTLR